MDKFQAVVELLEYWVQAANTASRNSKVHNELARALAGGSLLPKIDSIKNYLASAGNADPALLDRVRDLESQMQWIV